MTARLAKLTALAVAFLVVGLTQVVGATAASAATYDCTPMGEPSCKSLVPVATCTWDNRDGTRTAVWGYVNPSADTLRIDVGAHNNMSPAPSGGQPTVFTPGTYANVAVVTYPSSGGASWRLGNTRVSVSGATPACATKPVPMVGSVAALMVGLVALCTASALWALQRSRREGPAAPATVPVDVERRRS